MSDKIISTAIEILGKAYPVRCQESELKLLQEAAEYLNQKMLEVQNSGKAINLERIAIITALNITHEFLQSMQQKNSVMSRIHHRIAQLQDKLDSAMTMPAQTELIYSTE